MKNIIIFFFVFLSIAILSFWLPSLVVQDYGSTFYGFPFTFYYEGGVKTFDTLHLLFDLILWLIIAAIITKLFYKKER